MKSADYWAKRMEQLQESLMGKGDAYAADARREYDKALARITADVERWYGRLAANNDVSLADAKKLLTKGELQEFKWTVEEYIKRGRENAIDQRWNRELENASARVHITRLEQIQTQIRNEVEQLAGRQQQNVTKHLGETFKDGYYRSVYELQRGTGVGTSFAKLDPRQLDATLVKPWAPDGRNFSSRIWSDRDKLVNELQTTLTQSLINGSASDKVISDFAKRMGVAKSHAERLILTESAYFAGSSRLDAYKEMGVMDYEYTATLDNRTSEICREMDDRHFKVDDAKPGINYPPLHARCRSTTVPVVEDMEPGERAARDEDGSYYTVPGDMSYKDWATKHAPEASKPADPEPPAAVDPPKVTTVPPQEDVQSQPESGIMKAEEYRKFPDASDAQTWVDAVTPEWFKKLTQEEINAIHRYTGSAYERINGNLRNGGGDPVLDEIAGLISSGLQKFDLKDSIAVYRGMDRTIFSEPPENLPGSIVEELAFVSTTLLADRPFSGTVRLELRIPAHSTGAAIVPLSEYPNEFEFLLDKGTRYKIIEAHDIGGMLILIGEVLSDGG